MATRKKPPEIVKEAQKVFGIIEKIGRWSSGIIVVVILGLWIYLSMTEAKTKKESEDAAVQAAMQTQRQGVGAANMVPSITVVAPPAGSLSPKVRLNVGKAGCYPRGKVMVHVSHEVTIRLPDRSEKKVRAFEIDPQFRETISGVTNETVFQYNSLTGNPETVECLNATIVSG